MTACCVSQACNVIDSDYKSLSSQIHHFTGGHHFDLSRCPSLHKRITDCKGTI